MDIQERIRRCLILEEIRKNPKKASRIGLSNAMRTNNMSTKSESANIYKK